MLSPLVFLDYLVVHQDVDDAPDNIRLVKVDHYGEDPGLGASLEVQDAAVVACEEKVHLDHDSDREGDAASDVAKADEELVALQDHDEVTQEGR